MAADSGSGEIRRPKAEVARRRRRRRRPEPEAEAVVEAETVGGGVGGGDGDDAGGRRRWVEATEAGRGGGETGAEDEAGPATIAPRQVARARNRCPGICQFVVMSCSGCAMFGRNWHGMERNMV